MNIEIDSLAVIQQLKRDDIILQPQTNERLRVDQVCEDYFISTEEDEHRAMRMIYFSRLISEKWQIVKSNIQTETVT